MEKPSRIVIHAMTKSFQGYVPISCIVIYWSPVLHGEGAQDQIGGVSILDVQCILWSH